MIELAEDERQVFTERMVAEALKGKTPSESPTFYALVGAPGSGKSTLASTIDNAVVISSGSCHCRICENARHRHSRRFLRPGGRSFCHRGVK